MKSRTALVNELVQNPAISAEALEQLRSYGWDCEAPLATVRKADVLGILRKFEAGTLTAKEVQLWANRIEHRDDIDYELGSEGVVNEAVFWLANPVINFPIDSALCRRIEQAFVGDWDAFL
jgi:hypothetical protein